MMIAKMRRLGLFAALMLGSLQASHAQLSSPVSFFFAPTNLVLNVPLWHLSGSYDFVQQIKGAGGQLVDLSFSLILTNDSRGLIRGADTTIVNVGGSPLAGTYVAQGRVSGGGTQPVKMNFSVHFKGQGDLSGQTTTFNISLNYKLQVDADFLALVGTVKGNASFQNAGASGPVNSEIALRLPDNVTGAWAVTMYFENLNSLPGTATIVTSDGFILNNTLKGNYSGKRGQATFNLKGSDDQSKGVSAKIQFTPTALGNVLDSLRGHIFGQTLKF
jgi:hypothetical protein